MIDFHRMRSLGIVAVLGVGLPWVYAQLGARLQERFTYLDAVPEPAPAAVVPSEPEPQAAPSPLAIPEAPSMAVREFRPHPRLISGLDLGELHPALQRAVEFWKKIYSVYYSNQVVLHDSEDLSVIYKVIDFSSWDSSVADEIRQQLREAKLNAEIERLKGRLNDEEGERIRSQTGQKDKFIRAVRVSGRYLPHFEEIFSSHGLPVELTRLVFVESLFQEHALSRVGAAGLWQFMPATARVHRLTVDKFRDDRYDPLLACHAAASLLNKNYQELGSWPLAITAYNAGVGMVRRATRRAGTGDLGEIIEDFETSGVGFATRNFFAEFLAAREVYQAADQLFGKIEREPLLEFDLIRLPVNATLAEVAHLASTSLDTLKDLNPSYASSISRGEYSLSTGTEIRIPFGHRDLFASRFLQAFQENPSPVPANFESP